MVRKFDEAGMVPQLRYASLLVSAGRDGVPEDNELIFGFRKTDDKNGTRQSAGKREVPVWLRLSCRPKDGIAGTFLFLSESSEDGLAWASAGDAEIKMDGPVLVGLVGVAMIAPEAGQVPPKVQARLVNVTITPAT